MIEHWIVNALVFSIAPLIYICSYQYKDIKELKKINKLKDDYIKHLEDKK
jgi:hypothetical protein